MLVVYGTVCVDRLARVDDLPRKGGYVEIVEEVRMLGGEAANTALALAHWWRPPVLIGNPIGTGDDADFIRKALAAGGLDRVHLDTGRPAGPAQTPICDIYVTPDGERTMFGRGFRDLEKQVDSDAIASIFDQLGIGPETWFTAEPNHGDVARRAVESAAERGASIYLLDFIKESDPVPEGAWWQSSTDWIGIRGDDAHNLAWVREFSDRQRCFCILSDGPNGFVAGGLGHPVRRYPAFPCPESIDSTGAGDVFRAGMLYGADSGMELGDGLRFASAAGCLNCLGFGGAGRLPSVAEIEAHIAAYPEIARAYGGCS
ncbi:MAG TPA: carbohydrate kinase family protein [Fimbriimonadaceae bacterium]|nr:carbohydrate kinase family protein [Fimbriimonadaceae bacterium]HRJ96679.1 carbohydrate kinase family protein [Fimbriimonadaceae bacterium]